MLLNSNSDNSNFSLIRTGFFSVLLPKNALDNLDLRTFTVINGKKNEDKYLMFTLSEVKYLLVTNKFCYSRKMKYAGNL